MNAPAAKPSPSHTLTSAGSPFLGWMRFYKPATLRADVVAGVTLAAYLIPASIGDASLANLPPTAGLYACLCSGLVFWALCSSRQTSVTVTSAISLLMGSSLATLAGGDTSRFAALAAATALFVGVIAVAAWLVKAGTLVSFISETVLIGFKIGVALTLASTQLPKLFGISGAHGNFWSCASFFADNLEKTNPTALLVGLSALAMLAAGKAFLKNKPVAIVVVAAAIIAADQLDLGSRGVKMLGHVTQGAPSLALPAITTSDINEILPLSMACFLLAAIETSAIGRMFASKRGYRFDANREFLALGGANLAAGLGGGFPVSGGMSQSLVNDQARAQTPISSLVAALAVLAVVLFMTDLLKSLPQPVLAAIVLMAIPGLVNVAALKRFWQVDRAELAIALAALAGVLASGLLRGALLGAVISMLLLIRRAARPHVAFLGRVPGTRRFSDIERHFDNVPCQNALIFRPEGSLVYFNAEHVRDTVIDRVAQAPVRPALVVCDLSASPIVDLAGAHMLIGLHKELQDSAIRLHIVEARASVRDRLRAEGLEEKVGPIDRFKSVADVIDDFEQNATPGMIPESRSS